MKNKLEQPKYLDKNLSLKERKRIFDEEMEKKMNPKKDFDPDTFEPFASEDILEVNKRIRTEPPKKLPTYGIKPKPVREGQMIGMYESKQDIYLIMAHRCNDLQKQIDTLKAELNKLKK